MIEADVDENLEAGWRAMQQMWKQKKITTVGHGDADKGDKTRKKRKIVACTLKKNENEKEQKIYHPRTNPK